MWVALAKIPNSGDMEPEEATPSQTGPLVEGWRHQDTNKTFHPKLFLSKRNARTKMGQRLKKRPSNDWSNLGSIPWVATKP